MGFLDTFQRMSVEELKAEVISLLKQAYADGRIGVETLDRRLRSATKSADKEELIALVADIPAPEDEQGGTGRNGRSSRTWMENSRVPGESQSFFALLGGSSRTGRWQPARRITCLALMGSVKLDFREADFPPEGVRISAGCVMGGLEIILPPGIRADLSGLPLLGSLDNKAGEGEYGAPAVTVRALAVMGGVEIRRRELPYRHADGRNKGKRNRR